MIKAHVRGRGFAFAELVMLVVVVVLVAAVLALVVPDSRRRARLAGSIANLQQIGKAAGAFAADHENRVYSLNWAPGVARTCGDYTFPTAATYNEAAAHQAVCILRDRAGRTDIAAIGGWIPMLWYNHLVLVDYLDDQLPSSVLVSPGDTIRLAWQRSLAEFPADPGHGYFQLAARPAGSGNAEKRWPYSSSYEMQPSFFSPDAQVQTPEGPIPTVAQDVMGHRFINPGTNRTVIGNRRFDEVAHPSHKAFVYEMNQRFFGQRQVFFMYREARVPVLLAEGSVSVRSINRANPGFFPNTPTVASPTRTTYAPELSWESPTVSGATAEVIDGHIRWTRSGLRGRDFQGPEVPWTP